jgi:DivIVA domain-containing protein
MSPEKIRNASFSLHPTGYNPAEVDTVLSAVADRVASGEDANDLITPANFGVVDVGYAPEEVDAFFSELSAATAVPPNAAEEGRRETNEDDPTLADVERRAEAETIPADADSYDDDEFAHDPPVVAWQVPSAAMLDLEVLVGAVDRTADTLASLRSFIENEVGAMKLAAERQAQETESRCEQILRDASAEAAALTESANAEIARARKAAGRQRDKERRDLDRELKQARSECAAEVAQARAAADEYVANARAEADRDRAEAQRTIESAIEMQSAIAESLERARQQLTPPRPQIDDLAA